MNIYNCLGCVDQALSIGVRLYVVPWDTVNVHCPAGELIVIITWDMVYTHCPAGELIVIITWDMVNRHCPVGELPGYNCLGYGKQALSSG